MNVTARKRGASNWSARPLDLERLLMIERIAD
jgi:hypothetical protein